MKKKKTIYITIHNEKLCCSCPAWKDGADKLVSVTYTCEGGDNGVPGTWGQQTLTPPGPIIDGPNIQDPSKSTDCGAKVKLYNM